MTTWRSCATVAVTSAIGSSEFGCSACRRRGRSRRDSEYAFHFGRKGEENPILGYDNHHGVHERHEGEEVSEVEFPGSERLLRRFIRELSDDVSP